MGASSAVCRHLWFYIRITMGESKNLEVSQKPLRSDQKWIYSVNFTHAQCRVLCDIFIEKRFCINVLEDGHPPFFGKVFFERQCIFWRKKRHTKIGVLILMIVPTIFIIYVIIIMVIVVCLMVIIYRRIELLCCESAKWRKHAKGNDSCLMMTVVTIIWMRKCGW